VKLSQRQLLNFALLLSVVTNEWKRNTLKYFNSCPLDHAGIKTAEKNKEKARRPEIDPDGNYLWKKLRYHKM